MFRCCVNFFDKLLREYTPDPFLLALFLTAIVFVSGFLFTPDTPQDMIMSWGTNFWNLIQFTMQMAMILVGGYVLAVAAPVKKGLHLIASKINTSSQAVIIVTIVSLIASLINWGLGLVVGAILCREIVKVLPSVNYRLLVASAYSGFIVWHGGLSASIPLVIATPGNFTEGLLGRVIPVAETLFSSMNLFAILSIIIVLPVTNWWLNKKSNVDNSREVIIQDDDKIKKHDKVFTPAERIEHSRVVSLCVAFMGLSYIVMKFYKQSSGSVNINDINFVFLFVAILAHDNIRSFINAFVDGANKVGPILLQFPFYAGIMGMLTSSQLIGKLSNLLVKIATPETFYFFTFLSAGIVNLFVPSGGGQWAVQGPVIIESAKNMGVDLTGAALAVAWGDAWTNLLQPFWALPMLAIANLHIRDIMGYCLVILITTGIVLSAIFLIA